jgi:hypothetical protein
MNCPTLFIQASIAVQNTVAGLARMLFGLKSTAGGPGQAAPGQGWEIHLHGNDALIGGIGSTAATAMILLV